MNKEEIIDTEKALEEKKAMQKIFVCEHGYSCPVLILVIAWLEEIGEKNHRTLCLYIPPHTISL